MRLVKHSARVEAARCFYCGAGLRKGTARVIVVAGGVVSVHMRHPRRAGEVAA